MADEGVVNKWEQIGPDGKYEKLDKYLGYSISDLNKMATTNIGTISYAKLNAIWAGGNMMSFIGFRSFELGEPSGENKSVIAVGGYAVIDDIGTKVYRNASITCLEGSDLDIVMNAVFKKANFGSGLTFQYEKNSNNGGGIFPKPVTEFKIQCFNSDGVRTNYSATGNEDEVALIRYPMTVEVVAKYYL